MNFDLTNVVTPVDVEALERLLHQSKYENEKIEYLVNGFKHGFSIGYQGPKNVRQTAKNLPLRGLGTKTTLWNKVMKEVEKKRYAGPFKEIPYNNFIQSPIGLVPKDGGKDMRLIFHLSHPCNTGKSLNENTAKEHCRVKYPDFNEAIRLCLRAGKSVNYQSQT